MTRDPLLESDEPPPVEVINPTGQGRFVIVCDHAGRSLPRALGTLGLSPVDLASHIAWDIGIAQVARGLGRALDAPVFLQRYSRLVIDCNRPLSAPDSIPETSGGVAIAGNRGLSAPAVAQRVAAIFEPYHARIAETLAARSSYVLIALHSFTPELYGVRRPFHAGVLYERDTRLALPLLRLLRQEGALVVGDNEPYAASADTDYAIMQYGERAVAPYVELEVRQDLLADAAGQSEWVQRFSRLLPIASEAFRL